MTKKIDVAGVGSFILLLFFQQPSSSESLFCDQTRHFQELLSVDAIWESFNLHLATQLGLGTCAYIAQLSF